MKREYVEIKSPQIPIDGVMVVNQIIF